MLLLTIEDIKSFVNKLLKEEAFGNLLLYEAEVKNAGFFTMSGKLNKEFFDSEEELDGRTYMRWSEVSHIFYQTIRGKRLPVSFKIVLMPDDKTVEELIERSGIAVSPDEIAALFLNVFYDRGDLTVTTGTSMKIFTLDKQLDYAWEAWVKEFFRKLELT